MTLSRAITLLPAAALFVALFVAPAAGAQARGAGEKKLDVPATHLPPAGLCRIWVAGVPPDKQPAPTDCPTALRNKPANGTVVFGASKAAPGAPPVSLRSRLSPTIVPPSGVIPLRGGAARADARRDSAGGVRDTAKAGGDSVRSDSTRMRRDPARRDTSSSGPRR